MWRDKVFVSPFLQNADEIFQTARDAGPEDCDMAILVKGDGGIHMLPACDWELESMRLHHGARAAYRVSRKDGGVRLEARSASQSCLIQSAKPERLLSDFPRYLLH